MTVQTIGPLSIEDQNELQEAARKLCYFAAQGSQSYVSDLFEHLVKHSLADLPPGAHTASKIYEQLTKNVRVRLEYEQALAALRRLVEKKVVTVIDVEYADRARYRLPVEEISRLKQEQRDQRAFEKKVIQEWIDDVHKRHSTLTPDDAVALAEDLARFALRLYSLHSIESVSLYFGEDEKISELIEQVGGESLRDFLPERSPELDEIRLFELPRFFRDMPLDRKQYIAKQINPFFLLQMLQLDPSCARLVSKQIRGGVLFLDTNFLYRLLGFDGVELQQASERLLSLSRGLGYAPVVSPRTVDEYRKSIEQFKYRASTLPNVHPEVAEAALFAALEEDTNTQYWRYMKESNGKFSPNIHYELYRHLEPFLEKHGIAIDSRYDDFFHANDKLLAEEESHLRKMLPDWQPRHDGIVSHDAYHRLLILTLRDGENPETPLDATSWFLTCDTKLVVYDRRARARNKKLKVPFCVLTSHWMQLLSPFCAAVEGFDIIQAETLDSPLFRLFPSPDPEILQNIIKRMAQSEGVPPAVVARMVTNLAFVHAFVEEQDETKREELIQSFLEQFYLELEQDRQKLGTQVTQLQQDIQARDSQMHTIQADNDRLAQGIEDLKVERVADKEAVQQLERQLAESRTANEALAQQVSNATNEVRQITEQTKQTVTQSQAETTSLRQEIQRERDAHTQSLAQMRSEQQQQQQWMVKQQRGVYIVMAWVLGSIALLTIKPWEFDWPLKWLILTIGVVILVITQNLIVNVRSVNRYKAVALITFDLIALGFAILLPLGITVPETLNWLLWLAGIVGAGCAVIAVLPAAKSP